MLYYNWKLIYILDAKKSHKWRIYIFCCKIENHLAAILDFEKFRNFTEIFVDTYIKYRNCFLADEKFATPIRKLRRICDPPYY